MKSIILDGKAVFPSKIICVGRNYVDHIKELDNEIPKELVIFIKPNSSLSTNIYYSQSDVIHYEAELSFLIRAGVIYGLGFGLDLTKRAIQAELKAKGLPWERAKSFDNSAVFSEFVSFTGNLSDLSFELTINGELIQKADYTLMLNKPDDILKEINQIISFEDNDLLMTGTPKGVAAIHLGDKFRGKVFEKQQELLEVCWIVK